jgi:hypothetical protein
MNRVPLAPPGPDHQLPGRGNSIRGTERMTGTHRDTICRLLEAGGFETRRQPRSRMCSSTSTAQRSPTSTWRLIIN